MMQHSWPPLLNAGYKETLHKILQQLVVKSVFQGFTLDYIIIAIIIYNL